MERAGELLKRERERQQKSLRDIANATKISITALQAIEGDRVEFLPPPSYTRGFLKLYARELGIDPEEVLRCYEQEVLQQHKWEAQRELISRQKSYVRFVLIGCLVLACSGAALAVLVSLNRKESATPPPSAVSTTIPSPVMSENTGRQTDQEAQHTPPVTTTPEEEHQPSPPASFTVRIETRDFCWLRVAADDHPLEEFILKPEETYTRTASRSLQVRIGNPASVKVFFNDQPVTFAFRGKPVDLKFP